MAEGQRRTVAGEGARRVPNSARVVVPAIRAGLCGRYAGNSARLLAGREMIAESGVQGTLNSACIQVTSTREECVPRSRTKFVDQTIAEFAARQHGLVTRAQLLDAGIGSDRVRSRVRSRRLQPVHRGVYRVGPLVAPRSSELAAVLACGQGAVLSHWSAAVLWEVPADRGAAAPVAITTVQRDRGRRPGIRVHRVRALGDDEVTEIDGIPVTTLPRTILDVAGQASSSELRHVLAHTERVHVRIREELLKIISRYPKRSGTALLRALLAEEKPLAWTRSEAEKRFLKLIEEARLPRPQGNVRVEGHQVDFVWRAQRIVVEVDGFAFHSSRPRFENDRRRDGILTAAGFRVIRVTWRQMEHEPIATLVRVGQALARSPT